MKKKGYSERGLFGQINHYDAHGKKIGVSRPGFLGGMNHYDSKGRKTGYSGVPFIYWGSLKDYIFKDN